MLLESAQFQHHRGNYTITSHASVMSASDAVGNSTNLMAASLEAAASLVL